MLTWVAERQPKGVVMTYECWGVSYESFDCGSRQDVDIEYFRTEEEAQKYFNTHVEFLEVVNGYTQKEGSCKSSVILSKGGSDWYYELDIGKTQVTINEKATDLLGCALAMEKIEKCKSK